MNATLAGSVAAFVQQQREIHELSRMANVRARLELKTATYSVKDFII